MKITIAMPTIGDVPAICATLAALNSALSLVPEQEKHTFGLRLLVDGAQDVLASSTLRRLTLTLGYEGCPVYTETYGYSYKQGVHQLRQRALAEARLDEWLLFLDDDVLLHPEALAQMLKVASAFERSTVSFLTGAVCDVVNDRGYKDFELRPTMQLPTDGCNTHRFYPKSEFVLTKALAAAFCMINVRFARENSLSFVPLVYVLDSGGEDTLFAMRARRAGGLGFFVPNAKAYHLSKASVPFAGETQARVSGLLATALREDLDIAVIREAFPWVDLTASGQLPLRHEKR